MVALSLVILGDTCEAWPTGVPSSMMSVLQSISVVTGISGDMAGHLPNLTPHVRGSVRGILSAPSVYSGAKLQTTVPHGDRISRFSGSEVVDVYVKILYLYIRNYVYNILQYIYKVYIYIYIYDTTTYMVFLLSFHVLHFPQHSTAGKRLFC